MSNPRISVSQLKQLIQLRSNNLSMRDIARALAAPPFELLALVRRDVHAAMQ